MSYIEKSERSIGLIARYLKGSQQEASQNDIQKKFREITEKLQEDLYGSGNSEIEPERLDVIGWTEVELTTCDNVVTEPTIAQYQALYKTEWAEDRRRFYKAYPLLYHTFGNMVIFRSRNLYSLYSPRNQDYQKIIHF